MAERTPNYVAHAIMHSQELNQAQHKRQVQARGMHASDKHLASVGTLNSNASRLALSRPNRSIQQELRSVKQTFSASATGARRAGAASSAAEHDGRSFHEIRAQQKYAAGHAVSMLRGGTGGRTGNNKVDNVRRIRSSHALSVAGTLGLSGSLGHSQMPEAPPTSPVNPTPSQAAAPSDQQEAEQQRFAREEVNLKGLFSKKPGAW